MTEIHVSIFFPINIIKFCTHTQRIIRIHSDDVPNIPIRISKPLITLLFPLHFLRQYLFQLMVSKITITTKKTQTINLT